MLTPFKIGAVALLVGIVSLVVLNPASNGPFFADDLFHLVNASFLADLPASSDLLNGLEAPESGWGYRPAVSLSFYLQEASGWASPFAFRLVNLLIHLLNVFLLWLLVRRLSERDIDLQLPALSIAVFFLFHPSAWHSVLYISARSTLLVSTFTLLTILLTMNPGWKKLGALPAAFFAVITKETGLLALPLAILFDRQQQKKRNLVWVGAAGLFLLLALLYRSKTVRGLLTDEGRSRYLPHDWLPYVLGQIEVLWTYLCLMILPMGHWSFFHWVELRPPSEWTEILPFLLGLIAFVALLVVAGAFKRPSSKACFAAMVLTLIPEFLYPRELLANEQRIYLALAFFSVFLATQANPWPRIQKAALAGLLSLNLITSYQRATVYGQPGGTILEKDIERNPNNAFSKAYLGAFLWNSAEISPSELQQAEDLLSEALRTYIPSQSYSRWHNAQAAQIAFALAEIFIFQGRVDDLKNEIIFCENARLGATCQLLNAVLLIHLQRQPEAAQILSHLNQDNASVQLVTFELLRTTDRKAALEFGKKILPRNLDQKRFLKQLDELR